MADCLTTIAGIQMHPESWSVFSFSTRFNSLCFSISFNTSISVWFSQLFFKPHEILAHLNQSVRSFYLNFPACPTLLPFCPCLVLRLEVFLNAQCVKVSPDSPHKQVRFLTLSGQLPVIDTTYGCLNYYYLSILHLSYLNQVKTTTTIMCQARYLGCMCK